MCKAGAFCHGASGYVEGINHGARRNGRIHNREDARERKPRRVRPRNCARCSNGARPVITPGHDPLIGNLPIRNPAGRPVTSPAIQPGFFIPSDEGGSQCTTKLERPSARSEEAWGFPDRCSVVSAMRIVAKPILRHIAAMWLERPQKTRKFGSMCPWIRSVIASNLARTERRGSPPWAQKRAGATAQHLS